MKKLIKIILVLMLTTLALTSFVGCGDTIYVTGIELYEREKTVLNGDFEVIVANVLPHNATNEKLQWETSDEKVVTVNSGVIQAISVGRATVTATTSEGGYSKSVEVVVLKNQFEVSKSFDKTTKG
ncbi:MAG: Ig-like domain-containing protein, partial [Clostridia bacterium]